MAKINIGIAAIALGTVGVDGGAGTTLAPLGYTTEGTAKLNWDDATETEFAVEEIDNPIYISTKEGKKTFTFTVANPDEDTLVSAFGGVKTGTGNAATFAFPSSSVSMEKTIKITPKEGMGLLIPRAKITAKLTSDLGRASLMGIEITGTVLEPTKVGVSALSTFVVASGA